MTYPERTQNDSEDPDRSWTPHLGDPAAHWRHSTPWLLVRAMRPRQWSKNILVFAAPAAASVLGHWSVFWRVVLAFLLFCAAASGHYLINDVLDAEQDRHHPVKRMRPVASGELPASVAVVAGVALIAVSIAGAAVLGPWGFVVVVAAYLALTAAYSLWLKRQPVMELAVVALGFVLRAVAGGLVAHVYLSNWFLVFTSFAALFVVTGKRYAEHARLGETRGIHRSVLDEYTESFLRSTLTICASVTVATYCLWAFDRTRPPGLPQRASCCVDRVDRRAPGPRRPAHLPAPRCRQGRRAGAFGAARPRPAGVRAVVGGLDGHRHLRVTAIDDRTAVTDLDTTAQVLSGWGRTAPSLAAVASPGDEESIAGLLETARRPIIARGLGRSYGDAAQSSGGVVVETAQLAEIGTLDEGTGCIEVGGGVSLHRLMQEIIPQGWFVAVTPGTRYVSVGGAIASDIHGKNHHCDGSFARHVTSMVLATPTGTRVVTPHDDAELFWATAGGMGLTGVVLRATLRLLPIETSWMQVENRRFTTLDGLMSVMEQSDDGHRYSVAWLDCLASRAGRRRSILTLGDHAPAASLPARLGPRVLEAPAEPRLRCRWRHRCAWPTGCRSAS